MYPIDSGVTTPVGYTLTPSCNNNLSASASQHPSMNANIVYDMYGSSNMQLLGATSTSCNRGCLTGREYGYALKPDPRSRTVKPLYDPSIYQHQGPIPTFRNVLGMYY